MKLASINLILRLINQDQHADVPDPAEAIHYINFHI